MMQAQPEPFPKIDLIVPTGLFLITEDALGVASCVAELLQQKGSETFIISAQTLQQPDRLSELIAEPVMGILHLASLVPLSLPETLFDWKKYTQIHSKSLFYLVQKYRSATRILTASLLGGYFGRKGSCGPGLPTGGSGNGLLKTLRTERQEIAVKAVDFDLTLSPQTIAKYIYQELLLPGGRVEVGYPQGQRTIFQTAAAPLTATEQTTTPSRDWVVLVTGGARGITAEIVKDLARSGLTLAIVGRSPEPSPENPETADIRDGIELRKKLLQQRQKQGLSITPAQIERLLWAIRRDRAIRRNLKGFRQAGATVEYLQADVRDESEFGNIINGIYNRYGRLDAVLHGAGIIEDKLIADKTPASFDRVFDTKADSAFILSRYLRPESLKLLVFFTSVAGRYGNRGQSDYAAANEVVNRLAWYLHRIWENTKVVAINWGPWDTTGMASAQVKRQFRERGIIPIPLAAGCQFFREELRYGLSNEVEAIAGEGPWETYEVERAAIAMTTTPTKQEEISNLNNRYILLSGLPQLQPNSIVTLEHTFCATSDPYLLDHSLDGKPVLPAAGALEWIAEFVASAWPEWTVCHVQDLRVLQGLVLDSPKADKTVLFKAKASTHADAETLQVTAEILDANRQVLLYRASVILRPRLEAISGEDVLPLSSGIPLDKTLAYQDYLFHGSSYHLITSIERINEGGIDALVLPSNPSVWLNNKYLDPQASWLFDPGLVDTAPQLAIVWARVQWNTTALPSRFGKVARSEPIPLNKPLQIQLRVKPISQNPTLVYDATFLDDTGKIYLVLTDIESTCNTALNRLANK